MADFPATLPQPLQQGYGVSPQPQTIRTEMETGAPRVRRRSAVRLDHIDVGWTFTDAQMVIFRDWFDSPTGAAGGAGWFVITVKGGTGGGVTVEARFLKEWQAALSGRGVWRVSAQIEVRYA